MGQSNLVLVVGINAIDIPETFAYITQTSTKRCEVEFCIEDGILRLFGHLLSLVSQLLFLLLLLLNEQFTLFTDILAKLRGTVFVPILFYI